MNAPPSVAAIGQRMKEVLGRLVLMQELEYVLLEQEGFEDPERLSALQGRILELVAELPVPVARLYQKLKDRCPPVVVVALDGRCSACSVRMPTAQREAVRIMRSLERCQSCSRILYHPGIAPQQLPGAPTEQRAGVTRFTSVELMQPQLEATTGAEAIAELVRQMARLELVSRPEELVESALRRESLAPTVLGKGLAIPHVRSVEGGGLRFALGLKKEGFAFAPSTEEPTRIVFFFIIPTAANNSFLELLAGLVKTFREEEARQQILACSTAAELLDALAALTQGIF